MADDDHGSHGPTINIVNGVLVSLAGVFLGLRLFCRCRSGRSFWWDDYILIASWICTVVATALEAYTVSLGFGRHAKDIPAQNFVTISLVTTVVGTFGFFSVMGSKTSFALSLLRLTSGRARAFVLFVLVTINVFMVAAVALQWARCSPASKGWDFEIEGECWPISVVTDFDVFIGAYSGAMDIVLALLPWQLVWGLQMQRKERIGIAVAMSMGVFAGAAAFVRCAALESTTADVDFTYSGYLLLVWSTAEATITIMASSIPVLRVLVREVGSAVTRPGTGSTGYYRTDGGGGALSHTAVVSSAGVARVPPQPGVFLSRKFSSTTSRSHQSGEDSLVGPLGQIMRTSEVALHYEDGRGGGRAWMGGGRG